MLELASKASIVCTLAVYVVGFVVTTWYYSRLGVPSRALSHETYLGAGILCTTLIAVSVVFGIGARSMAGAAGPQGRVSRWLATASHYALWALFACIGGLAIGSLWAAAFMIALTLLVGVAPTHNVPSVDHGVVLFVAGLTKVSLIAAFPIAAFALVVFPRVPAQFGGGQPVELASVTVSPGTPASGAKGWMVVSCASFPVPAAGVLVCRRFFRIYETAEHVYLGVGEWDGACPATTDDAWSDVLSRLPRRRLDQAPRRCAKRVANSLLPDFERSM
jgi:hypothetical protein